MRIKKKSPINYLELYHQYKSGSFSVAVLLLVYFLCRLLFQQLPYLKIAFIYPTGVLVKSFYGFGEYVSSEWLFLIDATQFVLDNSCSGTTFYSLLVSYLAFRLLTHKQSIFWLIAAYPIALVANAIRVISSIYANKLITIMDVEKYNDQVHVMTGVITFFLIFLILAYFIEKPKALNIYEH